MSVFYVVSKVSEDASDYASSVVFNNTNEDFDNEAAANEYRDECATLKPWQSHAVLSEADYESAYGEGTDAGTDPVSEPTD